MRKKLKEILSDERKKTFLVLLVVTLLLFIAFLVLIIVLNNKKPKNENKVPDITNTSKIKDIFKGYETTEYNFSENPSKKVNYDYKSRHEFIYANGEDRKTIYTNYKNKELYYELTLIDGLIVFSEQKYNNNLNAYEFTVKNYRFQGQNKITDYLVVSTCEDDTYSIIAKDAKNNLYVFNTPEQEFDINYIINNIKKTKVISNVKKVGYYTYNNYPHRECNEYDLVYLDSYDNVRYVAGKNALFFDDVYYRYIGYGLNGNYVYVLKDGLMQFETDNTKKLNDGEHNIIYMGSFYTLNDDYETLYIIGTNGYMYKLDNFSLNSKGTLEKINKTRIKKIGFRTEKDASNYAKDTSTVMIEFEDNQVIEINSTHEFELLS